MNPQGVISEMERGQKKKKEYFGLLSGLLIFLQFFIVHCFFRRCSYVQGAKIINKRSANHLSTSVLLQSVTPVQLLVLSYCVFFWGTQPMQVRPNLIFLLW